MNINLLHVIACKTMNMHYMQNPVFNYNSLAWLRLYTTVIVLPALYNNTSSTAAILFRQTDGHLNDEHGRITSDNNFRQDSLGIGYFFVDMNSRGGCSGETPRSAFAIS